MRLSEYLEPELVVVGTDTTGIEDTIQTLVGYLGETGHITNVDTARKAVLERERSHTTSLGNGVALPHATLGDVDRTLILVATAPEGVRFGPGGDDQEADRLFFLLLSPLHAAGTHIKILARIVRLVRSREFVRTLVAADSGVELVEAIEREDALHV